MAAVRGVAPIGHVNPCPGGTDVALCRTLRAGCVRG